MSYYKARLHEEHRNIAKDIYVTDAIKIGIKNLAEAFGGDVITVRYIDLIQERQETTEKAENIKQRIKDKVNGRI